MGVAGGQPIGWSTFLVALRMTACERWQTLNAQRLDAPIPCLALTAGDPKSEGEKPNDTKGVCPSHL